MYTFNKKESRAILSYSASHQFIPLDHNGHSKSSEDAMKKYRRLDKIMEKLRKNSIVLVTLEVL
jgi:hypothetical protein